MNTPIQVWLSALGRFSSSIIFLLVLALYCSEPARITAQTNYQQLRSFGFPELSGNNPLAPLLMGSDGLLYGTTYLGGTNELGTVFRISPNGSNYFVLHHFSGSPADGASPYAGLIEVTNGAIYGTTFAGGVSNLGTIFRLDKSGSNYTVLNNFTGTNNGSQPRAELLLASDGWLYGTAAAGGISNQGTVFKLDSDGGNFSLLQTFLGNNGGCPVAGLVEGTNGNLFGNTLAGGGSNRFGTLFTMGKDGNGFALLKTFTGKTNEGRCPFATLLLGPGDALYGTTREGGNPTNNSPSITTFNWSVFKLNQDGSNFTTLLRFTNNADGRCPQGRLICDGDGVLYGTTLNNTSDSNQFAGTVFRLNNDGNGYNILHTFTNNDVNGDGPAAGLVLKSDGTLFGTTLNGGGNNLGTIFALQIDGSDFNVLHRFKRGGGDGIYPNYLSPSPDGIIYGTTEAGGDYDLGTVFRHERFTGNYAVLHSFAGGTNDGKYPNAVLRASDGRLYGTTSEGGSNNVGTAFGLDTNGDNYEVLKHFDPTNGCYPRAGLVETPSGYLWGTTFGVPDTGTAFPSGASKFYPATVFVLSKDGSNFYLADSLSSSSGTSISAITNPVSKLLVGGEDFQYLYGTAQRGTTGIVFRVSRSDIFDPGHSLYLNTFTVLKSLPSSSSLLGDLIEGSDGVLYGTSALGSNNNNGTIFKMNKDGSEHAILYQFNGTNGCIPWAGLVEGSSGDLYGITKFADVSNQVAVFRIEKSGSNYTLLKSFDVAAGDGSQASLARGYPGALFGTTLGGGDGGWGSLFQIGTPTPKLTLQNNGGASLIAVQADPNQSFQVQATTNLSPAEWETIGSNILDAVGAAQIIDADATNHPARFYRSATP